MFFVYSIVQKYFALSIQESECLFFVEMMEEAEKFYMLSVAMLAVMLESNLECVICYEFGGNGNGKGTNYDRRREKWFRTGKDSIGR